MENKGVLRGSGIRNITLSSRYLKRIFLVLKSVSTNKEDGDVSMLDIYTKCDSAARYARITSRTSREHPVAIHSWNAGKDGSGGGRPENGARKFWNGLTNYSIRFVPFIKTWRRRLWRNKKIPEIMSTLERMNDRVTRLILQNRPRWKRVRRGFDMSETKMLVNRAEIREMEYYGAHQYLNEFRQFEHYNQLKRNIHWFKTHPWKYSHLQDSIYVPRRRRVYVKAVEYSRLYLYGNVFGEGDRYRSFLSLMSKSATLGQRMKQALPRILRRYIRLYRTKYRHVLRWVWKPMIRNEVRRKSKRIVMNHRGYSISTGARIGFRNAYLSRRCTNYISFPKRRVGKHFRSGKPVYKRTYKVRHWRDKQKYRRSRYAKAYRKQNRIAARAEKNASAVSRHKIHGRAVAPHKKHGSAGAHSNKHNRAGAPSKKHDSAAYMNTKQNRAGAYDKKPTSSYKNNVRAEYNKNKQHSTAARFKKPYNTAFTNKEHDRTAAPHNKHYKTEYTYNRNKQYSLEAHYKKYADRMSASTYFLLAAVDSYTSTAFDKERAIAAAYYKRYIDLYLNIEYTYKINWPYNLEAHYKKYANRMSFHTFFFLAAAYSETSPAYIKENRDMKSASYKKYIDFYLDVDYKFNINRPYSVEAHYKKYANRMSLSTYLAIAGAYSARTAYKRTGNKQYSAAAYSKKHADTVSSKKSHVRTRTAVFSEVPKSTAYKHTSNKQYSAAAHSNNTANTDSKHNKNKQYSAAAHSNNPANTAYKYNKNKQYSAAAHSNNPANTYYKYNKNKQYSAAAHSKKTDNADYKYNKNKQYSAAAHSKKPDNTVYKQNKNQQSSAGAHSNKHGSAASKNNKHGVAAVQYKHNERVADQYKKHDRVEHTRKLKYAGGKQFAARDVMHGSVFIKARGGRVQTKESKHVGILADKYNGKHVKKQKRGIDSLSGHLKKREGKHVRAVKHKWKREVKHKHAGSAYGVAFTKDTTAGTHASKVGGRYARDYTYKEYSSIPKQMFRGRRRHVNDITHTYSGHTNTRSTRVGVSTSAKQSQRYALPRVQVARGDIGNNALTVRKIDMRMLMERFSRSLQMCSDMFTSYGNSLIVLRLHAIASDTGFAFHGIKLSEKMLRTDFNDYFRLVQHKDDD